MSLWRFSETVITVRQILVQLNGLIVERNWIETPNEVKRHHIIAHSFSRLLVVFWVDLLPNEFALNSHVHTAAEFIGFMCVNEFQNWIAEHVQYLIGWGACRVTSQFRESSNVIRYQYVRFIGVFLISAYKKSLKFYWVLCCVAGFVYIVWGYKSLFTLHGTIAHDSSRNSKCFFFQLWCVWFSIKYWWAFHCVVGLIVWMLFGS